MKIKNVKIENVTVESDDRDRLVVSMNFNGQFSTVQWRFDLSQSVHVDRLMKLMNYLEVYNTEDMNGKVVRKVEHKGYFCGFGHPIEDKFIIFKGSDLVEVDKDQLEAML